MDMERERGGGGACEVEVRTCSDTTAPHREASKEPVHESNMHFFPPKLQPCIQSTVKYYLEF